MKTFHDNGKPWTYLLALAALALFLVACGPSPDTSKKKTPTPAPTMTAPNPLQTVPVPIQTKPPATVPIPVFTKVPAPVPTKVPTKVPAPVPSSVATRNAVAVILVQAESKPCWARSTRATCTPTVETAAPTRTPVPTATPCWGPDPIWSCQRTIQQFEAEVARLINEHRALPSHAPWWWPSGIALDLRSDLTLAEEGWTEYLVRNNLCEHGDFGTRAAEQGYTGFAWGNIGACGYPNPAETVQGWIDSPAHHWIMDESAAMTEFGVGAARFPNNYVDVFVTIGCGGGIPCMAGPDRIAPAPVLEPIVYKE